MKNPIIEFDPGILLPGEQIAPLNPFTNKGYVIAQNYFVTTYGRYFSIYTGKFKELSYNCDADGYLDVQISTTAGRKHVAVHRGVMATFAPVPNMYDLQVDHWDGNPKNNNITNLKWATSKQNNINAVINGITPPRSRTISDETVITIIHLAEEGYSDAEISSMIDTVRVAPETVRHVRTGWDIYSDVLKQLNLAPVLKRERTILTEEDYKKVHDLYDQGNSISDIVVATGYPRGTVRHIIDRYISAKKGINIPKVEDEIKMVNPILTITDYNGEEIWPANQLTSPLHILAPCYGVTKSGKVFSNTRGKWMELAIRNNTKGYGVLGLLTNHGTKQYFVHRIVMATFNPVPNMYELGVRHKNNDHGDNNFDNLEWATRNESMQKAAEHIVRAPQRAPDEDIIRIITLANDGKSDTEISQIMNGKYSPHNVRIIRSGLKTYGPVLQQLNLEPFKYHRSKIDQAEKDAIYNFIASRKESKMLMDLFADAAEEFNVTYESARTIYYEERQNRS